MWPVEEPHHKLGVRLQPLLLLEDCQLDEQGYFLLEGVVWPGSQEVKDKQAALLQAAIVPNYHLTVEKWQESTARSQFDWRESALK